MRSILMTGLIAGLVTGCSLSARADIVVTPAADATALGNGQTMSPFHNQGTGYSRYQQVYSNSLFSGFAASESISGIAFRAKQSAFGTFITGNISVSDIIITASTTQASDSVGLSANLDNNVGPDSTVVYSGPLTVNASSPGSTLIDYTINFQTPFVYTKGAGNLLLQFVIPATATVSTTGSIGFSQLDTVTDTFPSADGISSASSADPTQPVGSNSTTGLVTKFVGTPAAGGAVPEPMSLGILGLGTIALGLRRRR
jgi:hypothetical protein